MEEFLLLFRRPDINFSDFSPKEMEAITKKWQEWVEGIAAQGKLLIGPTRLANGGKVLKQGGVVTDGPFVEIREHLGGFIKIKADNLDEAVTLAHGCPVLEAEGSVEVRPLFV